MPVHSNKLKICSWNSFCLTDERRLALSLFLVDSGVDVMCLNELKLSEEECNFHLRFSGYRTFLKLRDGDRARSGGGVCVLVKESLEAESYDSEVGHGVEAISLSISCGNYKFKLLLGDQLYFTQSVLPWKSNVLDVTFTG